MTDAFGRLAAAIGLEDQAAGPMGAKAHEFPQSGKAYMVALEIITAV